jgi:alkylation response protein AidB-like acyl-CoA dehydrogenase
MNFGFTQEQDLLRDQVRRFLDDNCAMPEVRKIMKQPTGLSTDLWQEMAGLGLLGLIIPAEFGGVGLYWEDLIIVLEEMGRSLLPSPFISATLAASTLVETGSEDQKKKWLPEIAGGSKIATCAILDHDDCPNLDNISMTLSPDGTLTGHKPFVPDAGVADLFLVAFRDGSDYCLALVARDEPGVETSNTATMDESKRTGTLKLDNLSIDASHRLQCDEKTITRLLDKGSVAVTAEMIGAAETVLEMTTQYAKDRVQFGSPIGRYQGVKHRLAEIYLDIESFKSLLYYAAWTVDQSPDELSRSASIAKAYASDAFVAIGIEGVQLHGAIGFTAEYDVQLFLKRSKWARPMFGDSDYHYERIAALGGL